MCSLTTMCAWFMVNKAINFNYRNSLKKLRCFYFGQKRCSSKKIIYYDDDNNNANNYDRQPPIFLAEMPHR